MRRWFLGVSACGLLGWWALVSPVAYGQVEADPFNLPEDVVADGAEANGATDGDTAESTPPTTTGRSPFYNFGFGSQLTQEQLDQAEQIYREGTELAGRGDLNGALQKFAEALAMNPQHFPSYYSRGLIEGQQGFLERAILSLGTAISLSPRSYELYLERGQAYMDVERYRTAISDFQTAQTLNPGDAEILYWLGQAQAEFGYSQILGTAQQEKFLEAVASFDLALKIREVYPEVFFERGSARLQLGLLDDALDDLGRAVELDPENAEAVAQLGFASLQRASTEGMRRNGQKALIISDYQNSVDALTKYLSLLPPEVEEEEEEGDIRRENVYVARAVALNGLGDEFNVGPGEELSDVSRDYYRKAILDADASQELEPDLYSSYHQKGVAKRMLGEFDSAIDSFSQALERHPGDSESMLRRGIILFRENGDYELARTDFVEAARYSNNPSRAMFWTGLANAELGDFKQAIVAYSAALRNQTVFPIAYLNRGLAYMKVGRFERAIADFNEVLRRDRHNVTARSMRSQAQQLINES